MTAVALALVALLVAPASAGDEDSLWADGQFRVAGRIAPGALVPDAPGR
jgi:hypothetical protein